MVGRDEKEQRPLKLIIAGGRDFDGFLLKGKQKMDGFNSIAACIADVDTIHEVVCGCARGADAEGAKWAKARLVGLKEFPADWHKHGKAAGYIRNEQMAKYADALLAFWDGESKGTKHMIDLAKKHGLMIKVMSYDGKDITHTV